jgi:hypothetical protein
MAPIARCWRPASWRRRRPGHRARGAASPCRYGDAPRSPEPGVFSGGINASNGRASHRRRRAPGTSRPHRLRRLVDLHLGAGAIGTYRNARTPPSAQLYAMSADGAGRGGGAELSAAGALGGTGHWAAVAPGPRRSPRRTRRASGYASGQPYPVVNRPPHHRHLTPDSTCFTVRIRIASSVASSSFRPSLSRTKRYCHRTTRKSNYFDLLNTSWRKD